MIQLYTIQFCGLRRYSLHFYLLIIVVLLEIFKLSFVGLVLIMPPKKKAANGYKFAEPLPKGIILEDILKKKWRLGPSIGKGGFGDIYSAQDENAKGQEYPYVIKIEPHANGPLFVEIHFYIKHAKATEIENFKKQRGLKSFGMPVYYGSGSIEYKKEKYRFLVMDKFSTDLYKLYIDNNKVFPTDTVFKLGIQILDILEYIHQRGYVHADIKAANILLSGTKETQNKQVYLVDFGLVTKYTVDKEFKPNPKRAHDGTIEFLSRDAHQGVQTRRGDLEILAYNLIQWLGCKLPWEGNLNDPKVVHANKEQNMATVPKMIKASFGSKTSPKAITEFLKYLKTLKFNTEPDYNIIRDIFISGVTEGNGSVGSPLHFSESKTLFKRTRIPDSNSGGKKAKLNKDEENGKVSDDEEGTPILRKRGRKKNVVSKEYDFCMDTSDSEHSDVNFITRRKLPKKNSTSKINKRKSKSAQDLSNDIDFDGYNDAMKEIKLKSLKGAVPVKRSTRLQSNKSNASKLNTEEETVITSSDEEQTPKPKKRTRTKKDLHVINEEYDVCMSVGDTKKKIDRNKLKGTTAGMKRGIKISKSLDDLANACDFDGYTDAMKEVILKKQKAGGRKNQVNIQKTPLSTNQHEDDMAGFTNEMMAISQRKKSKAETGKRPTTTVPIATTSKASDKRGLVKQSSKRLQKISPQTHGEVLSLSDVSLSD